jgi:dihydroflavonol-4-reductase
MKTVVTGASGHLGANLIRALMDEGWNIRALTHVDNRALEGLDIETTQGDICDPKSLRRAFTGADTVFHAAGYISISMHEHAKLQLINVTGTRNVVEECLHCGVRHLVYFSSIHAFEQEPLDIMLDESRSLVTKCRNSSPYDLSKAAAEGEVRKGIEKGLDAVIINPTAIIGPYDFRPSHFGEALLLMARGKLPALVAGGFDWVDARDVAAGALQAAQQAHCGEKYLLSGHWVSVRDMAALVEEITGTRAPRFTCPLWLAPAGTPFIAWSARLTGKRPLYTPASLKALCSNRHISHRKATEDFGYHARPFRDTITDTLRWFKEYKYLDHNLDI